MKQSEAMEPLLLRVLPMMGDTIHALVMTTSDAPVPSYSVRLLTPQDAAAIPLLTERVNGQHYAHREVYDPAELLRLNREGRLISIVALDGGGTVVGHFGLERHDLGPIAELCEAMVVPEHRHRHVMEKMREAAEQEAAAAGLVGLTCLAVTQHIFTQLMDDHYGENPVGIMLGFASADAMNVQGATQRLTAVMYFKYLRNVSPAVAYVPAQHQAIMRSIYAALGRDTDVRTGDCNLPEGGRIKASISDWGTGELDVLEVGRNCMPQVCDALEQMKERSQVAVFYLRIPLADPHGPSLCQALARQAFFFSGLVPGGSPDEDRLQLQRLDTPFSLERVSVENPLAREILAHTVLSQDRMHRPAE